MVFQNLNSPLRNIPSFRAGGSRPQITTIHAPTAAGCYVRISSASKGRNVYLRHHTTSALEPIQPPVLWVASKQTGQNVNLTTYPNQRWGYTCSATNTHTQTAGPM